VLAFWRPLGPLSQFHQRRWVGAEWPVRWAAKRIVNPKLYYELAEWWPLLVDPDDYRAAAIEYARLLTLHGSPSRVLELGSGGGSNASFLKNRFHMTLIDVSSRMLEVSRTANPECVHVQGDMRTVRLGRMFDAVFVEDALSYMTTVGDLLLVLETAAAHCRPDGTCLFVPDDFCETYRPVVSTGGRDQGERSLRYLEWNYDPDPADTLIETDFAFLLRTGSNPTRVVHDHHTTGLFERALWLDLCRKAGFEPEIHAIRILGIPVEAILCTPG
jgi:SAM-dependent methyltransferase